MRRSVGEEEPRSGSCWFCSERFTVGQRRTYVYPVPTYPDRPVLSARHGAYACGDCLPGVRQAQRDQHLLGDAILAPWLMKASAE